MLWIVVCFNITYRVKVQNILHVSSVLSSVVLFVAYCLLMFVFVFKIYEF